MQSSNNVRSNYNVPPAVRRRIRWTCRDGRDLPLIVTILSDLSGANIAHPPHAAGEQLDYMEFNAIRRSSLAPEQEH
jgi:hypothetical protein